MIALKQAINDAKAVIRELRKELTSTQQKGNEEKKKTLQTQIQQAEEELNKVIFIQHTH